MQVYHRIIVIFIIFLDILILLLWLLLFLYGTYVTPCKKEMTLKIC